MIRTSYWQPTDSNAAAQLNRVLELYKQKKATLGFMPDSAFSDRGPSNGLALAWSDSIIVGYVLYDKPRSLVKLIHVCVDDSVRGRGVAKVMLDFIAADNQDRSMMVAACRDDYDLDRFWRSVAMRPLTEKPGRALNGSNLVNWVRPLGQPDLLEQFDLFSGRPLVQLDTNICGDLFAPATQHRPNRSESVALLGGWLENEISYVISPEVDFELRKAPNKAERQAQQNAMSHLTRLTSTSDSDLAKELAHRIGAEAMAADASLETDIRHLANGIHNGASYFITNDENLQARVGSWMMDDYQVEVLRPHQLVTHLRKQSGAPTFESRLIDSVDLTWRSVADQVDLVTTAFLNHDVEEKGRILKQRVRSMVANAQNRIRVLSDDGDRLWALLSSRIVGSDLVVDLVRPARGQSSATMSFQLARHLRREARDAKLSRIQVVDRGISGEMRAALEEDGFRGDPLTAHLRDEVWEIDNAHMREFDNPVVGRRVAQAERRYWPLTVVGADIPTFVIPIQPRYAEKLFGYSQALVREDRKRGLGLSREHVYFLGGTAKFEPNARLLWYVSADQDKRGNIRHIERRLVATSRLIESVTLPVDVAHNLYGHVGAFHKRDIVQTGGSRGKVQVVRFEDTELLESPVSEQRFKDILRAFDVHGPIQSARRVSAAVFDTIVAERGVRL